MSDNLNQANERCSIIVVQRDRFSTTEKCIDHILQNTPEPYDLIVVFGGTPQRIETNLRNRYGSKAKFIFEPNFTNPHKARNIGLRAAATRFAVVMDNDVYVRPGWLAPLLECQRETGASMVTPLILETEKMIHAAGNGFYVTQDWGRTYGFKELRYYQKIYSEGTNLKRERTDYGELHCQLVEVELALRLGIYDEKLQDLGECDSGLTWKKAGLEMWFEPRSVVLFDHPITVTHPDDVRYFIWRWNMKTIFEGYQHFEKKWGIDMTEYHTFQEWLLKWNKKLGFFPRIFPYAWALWLDLRLKQVFGLLIKLILSPLSLWNRFVAWRLGFYGWPRYEERSQ